MDFLLPKPFTTNDLNAQSVFGGALLHEIEEGVAIGPGTKAFVHLAEAVYTVPFKKSMVTGVLTKSLSYVH